MKKVKIGVVITARDVFPPREYAKKNAELIKAKLDEIFAQMPHVEVVWGTDKCDDGMVTELDEIARVTNYFIDERVDALFVPHANFGQEEAVGMIASKLRVPTLIWGPRDGDKDPAEEAHLRDYDTQCGLFATTRMLMRSGLPYTYLRNCWLDSPELAEGIDKFVRVAMIVKQFRDMRVLQLSTRPRQFNSVKVNEGELMEKFGMQIVPIESQEIIRTVDKFIEQNDDAEAILKDLDAMDASYINVDEEARKKMAALICAIRFLAEKYQCTTIASDCWSLIGSPYGIACCFAFGYLSGLNIPTACETDIHGAVSAILAQASTLYECPSFLADITIRHPYNDNAELLWHCGPFPPALSKEGVCIKDCKGSYQLKDGHLTLVRFDADHGTYKLFVEEADTCDGPKTTGNYVWFETKDWGKWEDKLMYGPYIHHIAGVYGSYKEVFREACKYLGVEFDCVD